MEEGEPSAAAQAPITDPDEEHGDDANELIDAEVIVTLEDAEMPPVDSDDDDGEGEDGGAKAVSGGDATAAVHTAAAPAAAPVPDESAVQWRGHAGPVYTIATSPVDARLVATGGGDDKAFLWDMETGAPARELAGHRDTVNAVGFSHDGVFLSTAGLDSVVAVWRASDGVLACTLEGPSEAINWLAWHQRGHVLLVGSEDTTCWMWKVPEGECMQIFAAHAASVTCGAFSGDGKAIVTGSEDATVRVWNPRSGTVVHCVQQGAPAGLEEPNGEVACLACHPASPVAIFGVVDGRVTLVHLDKGTVLASWHEHGACVEAVGFYDASRAVGTLGLASSVALDGSLCIWDTNTLTLRHKCVHPDGVSAAHWHPKLPLLATAGLDGVARIWDTRSGTVVRELRGHTAALLDIRFAVLAGDAMAVVTSSDDHTARVFLLAGPGAADP